MNAQQAIDEFIRDITSVDYIVRPKSEVKARLFGIISNAIEQENLAWRAGERCERCGGKMPMDNLTNMCTTCWEEA